MTQDAINAKNPFVQLVSSSLNTLLSISATIPSDDSIPQNTEGTEVLTVTITPKFSTSTLEIVFCCAVALADLTSTQNVTIALFQDTTANALAAESIGMGSNASRDSYLHHVMTSGTTSATTFKIRIGANTNTVHINGTNAGVQVYGGVSSTSLIVKEYI